MENTATRIESTPCPPTSRRRSGASSAPADARWLLSACAPARLPEAAVAAWVAVARPHELSAGSQVLRRDEGANSLWLVTRGRIALGMLGEDGQLQHRRSVEAGEWLDASSALLGGAHLEDALAEQDGEVWQLPWEEVLRAGHAHPAILAALATSGAAEVRALIEGTRSLVMKDVQARCASWLLEHAQCEERVGTLRLHQRKRAIAQQLGTTAETFSRTLRQLTRRGLIEVRGYTIILLDLDGLRALAEPSRDRNDRNERHPSPGPSLQPQPQDLALRHDLDTPAIDAGAVDAMMTLGAAEAQPEPATWTSA